MRSSGLLETTSVPRYGARQSETITHTMDVIHRRLNNPCAYIHRLSLVVRSRSDWTTCGVKSTPMLHKPLRGACGDLRISRRIAVVCSAAGDVGKPHVA